MLGNFKYSNPTTLYFGENSLDFLKTELEAYGKNVLLVYGEGSIKKNGIYGQILNILKSADKNVYEDFGVMPNPTVEKLYEGIQRARSCNADLILAVGGGSVCDYAKAVSVSVHCKEDPWDKYYKRVEPVDNKIVPVGCVLTMVGTGSEMNGGTAITDPKKGLKLVHVYDERVFPKFAILNPAFSLTLPPYQMAAGIFDIMSHLLEQYLSGEDDNTTDYIIEGLLLSLINSAQIATQNPMNYEARSNIMWISTWALNTLVAKGKATDWMAHMIGHSISAVTNATHGMTLSAISPAYYRLLLPFGLKKFKRLAINVWKVCPDGKTDTEIATECLLSMESFMKKLGVVMHLSELSVTEDMLDRIADITEIKTGGYKILTREEILDILKCSM